MTYSKLVRSFKNIELVVIERQAVIDFYTSLNNSFSSTSTRTHENLYSLRCHSYSIWLDFNDGCGLESLSYRTCTHIQQVLFFVSWRCNKLECLAVLNWKQLNRISSRCWHHWTSTDTLVRWVKNSYRYRRAIWQHCIIVVRMEIWFNSITKQNYFINRFRTRENIRNKC